MLVGHGQAKAELGLDHFERWSWCVKPRQVVLALLTMLFLRMVRVATFNAKQRVTLRQARREASWTPSRVRLGRCPQCGERVRGAPP